MRSTFAVFVTLLCAMVGSAFANDSELMEVNKTVFKTVDVNGDGKVSKRELHHYRALVLLSMDGNDDGEITQTEFMEFGLGWGFLAEKRGKSAQYRSARVRVFQTWDADGNGVISSNEQRTSLLQEFFEASNKTNQAISLEQFIKHMPIVASFNNVFSKN